MLLPLINIFSLPPEAAQQQPRFFAPPLRCASAVLQINARLDVSIWVANEAARPCRMSLGALTMQVLSALPSPRWSYVPVCVDYVPPAALLSGVVQGLHRCGCQLLSSSSRARFHLIVILVSPWHNMSEIAGLTANDFLLVAAAV